mgnify:CR=1 FL=1
MRAIVTGANGFIGNNLYSKLKQQGYTVYGIDPKLKDNDILGRFKTQELLPKLSWNPDVIFHLGAYIDVPESFEKPNEYFDNNINSTLSVLEFARKQNCKVIYAGSASKHTNQYASPYASSKYIGEELCKTYKTVYNMDIEIARFYNVYGPGEYLRLENTGVIGTWRYNIANKIACAIVGDGEQLRDFIHVDDVIQAIELIMLKITDSHLFPETALQPAYDIGTGNGYAVSNVAKMLFPEVPIQTGDECEAQDNTADLTANSRSS